MMERLGQLSAESVMMIIKAGGRIFISSERLTCGFVAVFPYVRADEHQGTVGLFSDDLQVPAASGRPGLTPLRC